MVYTLSVAGASCITSAGAAMLLHKIRTVLRCLLYPHHTKRRPYCDHGDLQKFGKSPEGRRRVVGEAEGLPHRRRNIPKGRHMVAMVVAHL